jgi:repressor LexA
MIGLTAKQQQIVNFIQESQREGLTPTYQEIADEFGFSSINTVTEHVRLIRKKGFLSTEPGRARSFRVRSSLKNRRKPLADVPLLGSIPAGFAQNLEQDAIGCVSVDVQSLGIKPGPHTFALKVTGDSMTGKHIVSGDTVVLEHGVTPKPGDVVAALIDQETSLKTYMVQKGKPFLRAENPRYPDLVPAGDLLIQGVVVALLRSLRAFPLMILPSALVFSLR